MAENTKSAEAENIAQKGNWTINALLMSALSKPDIQRDAQGVSPRKLAEATTKRPRPEAARAFLQGGIEMLQRTENPLSAIHSDSTSGILATSP